MELPDDNFASTVSKYLVSASYGHLLSSVKEGVAVRRCTISHRPLPLSAILVLVIGSVFLVMNNLR